MSKRHIPKYTLDFEYSTRHYNPVPMAWKVKEYGAPTRENLEAWRVAENASFKPGGANAVTEGIIPHISKARITITRRLPLRGFSTFVVAETTMPMFEVV